MYKITSSKMRHILVQVFLSSLVFFFTISSAFATVHTRSEWISKYDTLDSGLYNGNGYSTSTSSDTLAWAQSYILLSYLNMYEATQNTDYLDSFTSQVNTMIGNMTDANNDGYDGWDTYVYSTNIVRNNGAELVDLNDSYDNVAKTMIFEELFETPESIWDWYTPKGWIRWQSTTSTAYRDSSNAFDGNYGCTVETNPGAGWQVIEKTISYEAGEVYVGIFRAKISGSGAEGYFSIEDTTTGKKLVSMSFDSLAWHNYKFILMAPNESGHTLKIRLYHTKHDVSNFAAHFDNIEIYRLDGNMLPENWTRWQSTSDTAYIDKVNKTEGNYGFTIETDPNVGWQLLESPLRNVLVDDNQNYEPGITYNISFDAKTSNASVGWRFVIYDFTASQTLYSATGTNTDWETVPGTFTAPSIGGHDVRARLYHINWSASGSSHFDNIQVQQYAEFAVQDGMIAMPIAKFIMMAYQGKIPSSYITNADNFLDLLEDHLFPKWDSCLTVIDSTKSVYVFPDDGSSSGPNNSLPHNQYLALGTAYAFLSRALDGTSGAAYATLAGKLISTFASKLEITTTENAYDWNYGDLMLTNDYATWTWTEDTSHGNIDIAAVVACYQAGISLDSTDMTRFANTFLCKMWDGSTSDPDIYDSVDGSGNSLAYDYTTWGWIQLGAFDRDAYDIVRTMHDLIWSDQTNMTWRRMLVISEIIKGVLVDDELFETADSQDSTLPDGWSRWNNATAYLDSSREFEGVNCLTIETNGTSWPVIEKSLTYEPGATYQLKIMGKISGNLTVGGYIHVYDYTTPYTHASASFYNTDWKQTVFTFTAPSTSGKNLKLRLYTTAYNVTDGVVHFDNIEICKID